MSQVTIRDLRHHGGKVIDRVLAGETLTVTRSGTPVALLEPLPRPSVPPETLLARWRKLPSVDPQGFRDDLDSVLARVRDRVLPEPAERDRLRAVADELIERAHDAIADLPVAADVVQVGSTARGTPPRCAATTSCRSTAIRRVWRRTGSDR